MLISRLLNSEHVVILGDGQVKGVHPQHAVFDSYNSHAKCHQIYNALDVSFQLAHEDVAHIPMYGRKLAFESLYA